MLVPLVGVPWFFLYYFTFRYLINRFDFATPGREKEAVANDVTFAQNERASAVIAGLGGKTIWKRWTAAPRVFASRLKTAAK